jgi:hypothetical protein
MRIIITYRKTGKEFWSGTEYTLYELKKLDKRLWLRANYVAKTAQDNYTDKYRIETKGHYD